MKSTGPNSKFLVKNVCITPGEFLRPSEDIVKCSHISFLILCWQHFKLEMRNSKYLMGLPMLIVYCVAMSKSV